MLEAIRDSLSDLFVTSDFFYYLIGVLVGWVLRSFWSLRNNCFNTPGSQV